MDYIELKIEVPQKNYDILVGELSSFKEFLGIEEDFDIQQVGLQDTYNISNIEQNLKIRSIKVFLKDKVDLSCLSNLFTKLSVEKKNYTPNNNWKLHFKPITVKDFVIKPVWEAKTFVDRKEIIINPGSAFGTGLHESTQLSVENMLSLNLNNRSVLDIGCGTGILSIIASKQGATPITAIDIDKTAVEETVNNLSLNSVNNVDVIHSGIEEFNTSKKFDIILANMISSILINNKQNILSLLNTNGILVLAGILKEEKDKILREFRQYFSNYSTTVKNEWISFIFTDYH